MDSVTQKRCCKCKRWKDRSEFYKDKYELDSLTAKCKTCCKAASQKWEQANPKKATEKANRNRRQPHRQKWYQTYYSSQSYLDKVKNWAKLNPEKKAIHRINRRAREKQATGTITLAEWNFILKKYNHTCVYPGCTETKVQKDHILPLVLGGTSTADNIQPLCKHHNCSKGTKHIDYRK